MHSRIIIGALLLAAAGVSVPIIAVYGQNPTTNGTAAGKLPLSQRIRHFSNQTLDKIDPGHTTKSQVEALLGKPWRATVIDEDTIPYAGDPSMLVWEYRGQDSDGPYKVHIEFDKHAVVVLIAKISDKTGKSVARVAKELWKIDRPQNNQSAGSRNTPTPNN